MSREASRPLQLPRSHLNVQKSLYLGPATEMGTGAHGRLVE